MSKYDPIEDISSNHVHPGKNLLDTVDSIDSSLFTINSLNAEKYSLSIIGDNPYNLTGTAPQSIKIGELLRINSDGTVEADTLENACLAGKILVDSIRCQLTSMMNKTEEDFSNDDFLNKTEDLHLLSKILDAMNNGEDITKAVSLISSVRKADRARIQKLEETLSFYGAPETYHGCTFMFDKPTGGFDEDFSDDHGHEYYYRAMPGHKAREALSTRRNSSCYLK